MTDENAKTEVVKPQPVPQPDLEPDNGRGADDVLPRPVLRGEHGPEFDVPPSMRTVLNILDRRRVIE